MNGDVTVVVVVVVTVVIVLAVVIALLPGVVEFSERIPSRHCKNNTVTSKKNCPPNNT